MICRTAPATIPVLVRGATRCDPCCHQCVSNPCADVVLLHVTLLSRFATPGRGVAVQWFENKPKLLVQLLYWTSLTVLPSWQSIPIASHGPGKTHTQTPQAARISVRCAS